MSTTKVVSKPIHTHINTKETDMVSKKDTSTKKKNSSDMPSLKKPDSINQSVLKESISQTDNIDSIIINLSHFENQNFSKKCDTNENLNNISDLIKAKRNILASNFQYITKPNEDDYFVYNKIVKNESTHDNKKTAGQLTTNLDNGFINETCSKTSNKETSLKPSNSFNLISSKLNQKIENMKSLNYGQYNMRDGKDKDKDKDNGNNSSQVKFSCCPNFLKK